MHSTAFCGFYTPDCSKMTKIKLSIAPVNITIAFANYFYYFLYTRLLFELKLSLLDE